MNREKLEELFEEIGAEEIEEIFEEIQIDDENMKLNIKNVILDSQHGDKINSADALKSILAFVAEGAYYYEKDDHNQSVLHESNYQELIERLELAVQKGIGVQEAFDTVYVDETVSFNDQYLNGDYSDDEYSNSNKI